MTSILIEKINWFRYKDACMQINKRLIRWFNGLISINHRFTTPPLAFWIRTVLYGPYPTLKQEDKEKKKTKRMTAKWPTTKKEKKTSLKRIMIRLGSAIFIFFFFVSY